jgi:glycerol-3-phosphate acyltransferase PlsY
MCPTIYAIFYTAVALLVIVRHHANIGRLIKGQESKISFKKK